MFLLDIFYRTAIEFCYAPAFKNTVCVTAILTEQGGYFEELILQPSAALRAAAHLHRVGKSTCQLVGFGTPSPFGSATSLPFRQAGASSAFRRFVFAKPPHLRKAG